MNTKQLERMSHGNGFIAALDQSGGSTPKALLQYGIDKDQYSSEDQMYEKIHEMRTRVIKSPAFTKEYILGVILFENTMDRKIDGLPTADFLWQRKEIVPFLKIDKGLDTRQNDVELMKPITGIDSLLKKAVSCNIFGTKMRSVIYEANPEGISAIVKQQFEIGRQIMDHGLVPIIEPEVDIHSATKQQAEMLLKEAISKELTSLRPQDRIMLKLTIPTQNNLYQDLMEHPNIVRIVALSGGYSRETANELLAKNNGLIASFSRALLNGLSASQSDDEFNTVLGESIKSIYDASVNKN